MIPKPKPALSTRLRPVDLRFARYPKRTHDADIQVKQWLLRVAEWEQARA